MFVFGGSFKMILKVCILSLVFSFCDAGYYHMHPISWSWSWGYPHYSGYNSQRPHYGYNYEPWGNYHQQQHRQTTTSKTTPTTTLSWLQTTQSTVNPKTNSPVTTTSPFSSIGTTEESSIVTQQQTSTQATISILENKVNENGEESSTLSSAELFEKLIKEAKLEESTRSTIVTLPNGSTYDPCNYNPEKPNFDNGERRISQIKCYEYLWETKVRKERKDKAKECIKVSGSFTISAVGGRDALVGEFPHMAAIGWKAKAGEWIFKCGGSLISSKYVLTAAHCTQSRAGDVDDEIPKIARLGDLNIIGDVNDKIQPTDVNIKNIIKHPYYNSPKKYFDIALIELENDVEFSQLIQPACLWPYTDTSKLGIKATLTGWGVVDTTSKSISPTLQAAEVEVIDQQLCDRLIRPYCNRNMCGVRDHQICAGNLTGGVDACQGDSGGPLQVKINLPPEALGNMYHIIGIISTGIGCAIKDLPGIYTRVPSFIQWIETVVWPNV